MKNEKEEKTLFYKMSMNHINSIEREVQTSLEYISTEESKKFRAELKNLKEEKKLLEGKIRGYLTLSDVCHEYKSELKKLQQEYNQLKEKINMKLTEKNDNKSSFSESPTPGYDPGHVLRTNDLDQRKLATTIGTTTSSFAMSAVPTAKFINGTKTTLENTPLSALPRCETPQNINERHSEFRATPTGHSLYKESIPMQESMVDVAQENKLSLSDMGFERVPASSALVQAGASQQDDLIVFGSLAASKPKKETMVEEVAVESLNIGAHGTDDSEDYNQKLIEVINQMVQNRTKHLQTENKKLKDATEVLTHENRELHEKLAKSKFDAGQLVRKVEELQAKLHSTSKEGSPQGWVHVSKVSEKSPVDPLKSESKAVGAAGEVNLESILQQNEQLKDANQKWVSEWDKLQEHFENRTVDLRSENDRLNKALTEAKIKEQSKEAEFEPKLAEAQQRAAILEAAKTDLTVQLASASQREDTLQARIHQLEELVTSLRREKQSTETELAVVKQQRQASAPLLRTSLPEGQHGYSQQELQTEVEVLRQQLLVFQEDFDRERQDRATAQSIKDDLKKKCDQYRKQLRLNEVKLAGAETQLKNSEDITHRTIKENEKLEKEVLEIKRQLRQAQEIREWPGFINSGTGLSPPTRNPPFQFQQSAYPYRPQPQPQQYIIPAPPQPQFAAPSPMMYMPNNQPPQVMRQGYYVGNQGNAGSQHENLPGAWSCSSCTYMNYPGRTVCEMCGYVQTMKQSSSQGNFNPLTETLRPRGDENQPAGPQHTGTARQNMS